jgi:ribosomal RNA-processing protein 12
LLIFERPGNERGEAKRRSRKPLKRRLSRYFHVLDPVLIM